MLTLANYFLFVCIAIGLSAVIVKDNNSFRAYFTYNNQFQVLPNNHKHHNDPDQNILLLVKERIECIYVSFNVYFSKMLMALL